MHSLNCRPPRNVGMYCSLALQAQEEQARARSAARRMSSAARAVKRAELAELEQLAKKVLQDKCKLTRSCTHFVRGCYRKA